MKTITFLTHLAIPFVFALPISAAQEPPKIAVSDLAPRNTPATHAQELTSMRVSEIANATFLVFQEKDLPDSHRDSFSDFRP